jgi:hypothetical protein
MKEKGFTKRNMFNREGEKFCQEREVEPCTIK